MEELTFPHKLTLHERQHLTVTGVREVMIFDDTAAVLRTGLGVLTVRGQELKLKNLTQDGGQLAVDGKIAALSYEEPKTPGGFWHRLFR